MMKLQTANSKLCIQLLRVHLGTATTQRPVHRSARLRFGRGPAYSLNAPETESGAPVVVSRCIQLLRERIGNYSRIFESMMMVTGPLLVRVTAMSAANSPVCTGFPRSCA